MVFIKLITAAIPIKKVLPRKKAALLKAVAARAKAVVARAKAVAARAKAVAARVKVVAARVKVVAVGLRARVPNPTRRTGCLPCHTVLCAIPRSI